MLTARGGTQKKNLYIPTELVKRAEALASLRQIAFSQFIREALNRFVEEGEREQRDKELVEACRKYRKFNKQFSADWAQFETRIE